MTTFSKIADLTVKDGTYQKNGREYNRYQNIGCLISTPHGSHMFVKLNATATSDSRIVSISPIEGVAIKVEKQDDSAN